MILDCYIDKPINTTYGQRVLAKERAGHIDAGLGKHIRTPQLYEVRTGRYINMTVYDEGEYFADLVRAAFEQCEETDREPRCKMDVSINQVLGNGIFINVDSNNPARYMFYSVPKTPTKR